MGCRMSFKVHFLHPHLDFFPENLEAVSDKLRERFHLDIQAIKERYQGVWIAGMMSDFFWILYCDDATHTYKRILYAKHCTIFILELGDAQVENNHFAVLFLNSLS